MSSKKDVEANSGSGPQAGVHVVPSQWIVTARLLAHPAATQFVALTHETPSSLPEVPPDGSGATCAAQDVPFHTATIATWPLTLPCPAATHVFAAGQETLLSWSVEAPAMPGTVWTLQA